MLLYTVFVFCSLVSSDFVEVGSSGFKIQVNVGSITSLSFSDLEIFLRLLGEQKERLSLDPSQYHGIPFAINQLAPRVLSDHPT
jgi:hypothetical protein